MIIVIKITTTPTKKKNSHDGLNKSDKRTLTIITMIILLLWLFLLSFS